MAREKAGAEPLMGEPDEPAELDPSESLCLREGREPSLARVGLRESGIACGGGGGDESEEFCEASMGW